MLAWVALLLSVPLITAPLSTALEVLPLGGLMNSWRLDNDRGFANATVSNITLPMDVQSALAKELGDSPLYRYGELEQRWVAYDNWTFSLQFELPLRMLEESALLLHLESVDTVSEVWLNDLLVGRTSNAHRPHNFDILEAATEGWNELRIVLFSAATFSQLQAAAYPYAVPRTMHMGGIPSYNFVRKAASDFGWDWGPAFAPAGIHGAVELRAFSAAFLTGASVRQEHHPNGSVALTAGGLLQTLPPSPGGPSATQQPPAEKGSLELLLSSPDGGQVGRATHAVRVPLGAANCAPQDGNSVGEAGPAAAEARAEPNVCSASSDDGGSTDGGGVGSIPQEVPPPMRCSVSLLEDPPLQLWWPHDLGAQPLYTATLTYTPDATASEGSGRANSSSSSSSSSTVSRRVGFRMIELVRQPLGSGGWPTTSSASSAGETFFFRVNGLPLYARGEHYFGGANMVPAAVFESDVDAALLRRLVADARAVGMNMLRVWGGGRYAQDAFYEACGEAGVLVWQEAMFACATYPRDSAFLNEVWQEVGHQAARLTGHPSIVLWGGNNENEAALEWFPKPRALGGNPRLYATDYSDLFVGVVRQALLEVDPSALHVDSSPSNGLLSEDPYVKRWGDVSDPSRGDVHFYDYNSDALDPATYPPAKFVSEFGFMSWPSFAEYSQATAPEDWALGAPMSAFRMRHANGQEELLGQLAMHFLRQDASLTGAGSGTTQQQLQQPSQQQPQPPQAQQQQQFEAFVYLTQLQQALAYETAAGVWRRGKADPTAQTMGMLYWQLNDVWSGPSWSGINAGGSWKLLHHAAARFFAPLAVSGVLDRSSGLVEVHITNDLAVGVAGRLEVEIIPYAATEEQDVVLLLSQGTAIGAFASQRVWAGSMAGDVLPALGQSLGPGAAPTDALLRARFCPTAVHQVAGYPNPFSSSSSNSHASAGGVAVGGSSSSRAEGCAGVGVQLPLGAGEAKCEAARRLLGCSEALLFPTELRDARLASVEVELSRESLSARGGVALFVSAELSAPGRFSDNGVLLLPWRNATLRFLPDEEGQASGAGAPTVTWLQDALENFEGQQPRPAAPGPAGPHLNALAVLAAAGLFVAAWG